MAQPKKQPPAKPLDINTATVEQLEQLPGIGPTTAKAIVHFREKSGPFRRVEDLLVIRGISRRKLERLRPYITVSLPPEKLAPGQEPPRPESRRLGWSRIIPSEGRWERWRSLGDSGSWATKPVST